MAVTRDQVIGLYRDVLGRDPYENELAAGGFVDKYVRSGQNINQLRSVFQSSDEAKQRASQPAAPASAAPAPTSSSPLEDFAATQARQRQQLLDTQKAEQESAFGRLETLYGNQEKLTSALGRLRERAGLPQLQEQGNVIKGEIYNVKGLLDRLDENIASRTEGTLTTSAQRDRMSAAEGGQLRDTLGRLATGYEPISNMIQQASTDIAQEISLLSEDQKREAEPLIMRINAQSDRFAREISGFNTDKETELTAIVDKLNEGRRLEQREYERLQQLAQEEREFQRSKELIAFQSAQSAKLNQDVYGPLLEQIQSRLTGQSAGTKSAATPTGSLDDILPTSLTPTWEPTTSSGPNIMERIQDFTGFGKNSLFNVLRNRIFGQ